LPNKTPSRSPARVTEYCVKARRSASYVLLGEPHCAVEHDQGHHLGVREVALRAARLPDTSSGLRQIVSTCSMNIRQRGHNRCSIRPSISAPMTGSDVVGAAITAPVVSEVIALEHDQRGQHLVAIRALVPADPAPLPVDALGELGERAHPGLAPHLGDIRLEHPQAFRARPRRDLAAAARRRRRAGTRP
jgi:hypothetical protein